MSLLALLMGAVMSGSTVIEYGKQPLDYDIVEQVSIQHKGYSLDNERQLMVQRAYEIGGLDFVIMIECESGFNPKARGDSGRAYGLCQMNSRYHKIPKAYYNDWEYQINYCYQKWSTGTPYYGPDRKIKGVKCRDYVLDRFIITGEN